ncbi:MAG: cell shape determination protein CcmA, partial [Thalassolituus sp.]
MFGSKNVGDVDYDTLISAKTEVVGDLYVSGAIHIGGTVKGNIVAEKDTK